MNRKLLLPVVAFMFALCVVFPFAVYGQDTPTPDAATLEPTIAPTSVIVEPPPPVPVVEEPGDPPAVSPENLLGQLFSLLKDGTYMLWAAAGVLVIVGLIKTLASAAGFVIEGNVAVIITLVVQVLIWITYSIANAAGAGAVYQEWYNRVIDFIRALLPLAGAVFVANWGYHKAAKQNTPIVGFKAGAKNTPPKPYTPAA